MLRPNVRLIVTNFAFHELSIYRLDILTNSFTFLLDFYLTLILSVVP